MKNKKLLILLADYLSKLDEREYQMTDYTKGPLGHATKLKEFKKAGWVAAVNDNEWPVGVKQPKYKDKFDCAAASEFFDISIIESQYLFGEHETDIHGYQHPPVHESNRKDMKWLRDGEPPQFTAARIRAFIDYPGIDCLGRVEAERM